MSIRNESRQTVSLSIDSIEKLAGLTHNQIIEHRTDAIIAQVAQIPA